MIFNSTNLALVVVLYFLAKTIIYAAVIQQATTERTARLIQMQ